MSTNGARTNGEVNGNYVNGEQVNSDHVDTSVDYDALVIGAGFGGLRMLYELRKQGFSGQVLEAGTGIGGTWYWNRYPGARTDSESWIYIFTFLERIGMEWNWQERFPQQPEVEEYLNKMADFLDLRKDIQLSSRVTAATQDEKRNVWTVTTEHGKEFTCRYLISAVGPLATPLDPPFPGLKSFKGEWYQTGLWPKDPVEFSDKRVAVIGAGATGVQVIPIIAHRAKQVTVFQRTPNYVMPARNHPLGEEHAKEIQRDYDIIFERARKQMYGFDMVDAQIMFNDIKDEPEEVERVLEGGWEKGGFRYLFETFGDMLMTPECNEAASAFVRKKIKAVVNDRKTAELLCPHYPLGAKRPPSGHYYYETFNRPNVELVDIQSDAIREITPTGLKTGSREFEFDMIVFAIGFDAITGTLGRMNITGQDGQKLADVLRKPLATNKGITMPGFSNMFMIFGPQAPFANGPLIIDATADWIGKTIAHMRSSSIDRVESTTDAAQEWADHVNLVFNSTLLKDSAREARAWNVGANVEGKDPQVLFYIGGVPAYITAVTKEINEGWPGHTFSRSIEVA